MNARVRVTVDLDALTNNLREIRELAGGSTRVMLVVKADAYGHGAARVAAHALSSGVGAFGVGTSGEALELRDAGVRVPILVLGTVLESELAACLAHDVHIGLHSTDRCTSLDELARRSGRCAHVHLNVDTGMGRLGVLPERALDLLARVRDCRNLVLAGVMTHISSSDGMLDPESQAQKRRFDAILARARDASLLRAPTTPPSGGAPWVEPTIHVANSASLFTGLRGPYDMVRPGIAAYGALPAHLPGADRLRPVLSLRSSVVFLKDVPRGTPVGYASTWRARRPTRLATLPIGYADGLPWRLGGRGEVLVRGRRAPIVGRISMDYTTIDVTDVPGVQVGDHATVFGRDGDEEITLAEVAERADTLSYELACSIGDRVERLYVQGEETGESRDPAPLRRPPGTRLSSSP